MGTDYTELYPRSLGLNGTWSEWLVVVAGLHTAINLSDSIQLSITNFTGS